MFRQNCVRNETPAGKFVEVLARINFPVHLFEKIGRRDHAALGQTERVARSRSYGRLHLQEIRGDSLDRRILELIGLLVQVDVAVVVIDRDIQREEWASQHPQRHQERSQKQYCHVGSTYEIVHITVRKVMGGGS